MVETVVSDVHGDVAVLRLDRPGVRNAVDREMAAAIVAGVAAAQSSACIVLTGTDPAFCAGLDLRTLGTRRLGELPRFIDAVADSKVPTIAAVNGAAVTGGLELALACDFMIASTEARFADTHLRVGVYPGPVLVELPRRVGMARAREMSLTGDFIDADTALRIGLVNRVVAHDDLMSVAVDVARTIAEHDRDMVSAMRRDWDETHGLPRVEAHRRHLENARALGVGEVTGQELAARREGLVARARTPPGT